MRRMFTQKEIYDYLLANPLNTAVHIGDLDDMQGRDYIFLDYLNDLPMLRDNGACYQTIIHFSIYTKSYEDRKTLTKYIEDMFLISPSFRRSDDSEYYVADATTGVFINE